MKLIEKDTFGDDINIAHLTDRINYQDLQESQDCLISVQYNELDFGKTAYGFNQPFLNNEANLYFERMKTFFALDPNCKIEADRKSGSRNPRIYFMVGYKGMIHPIFFDPYHELNPI